MNTPYRLPSSRSKKMAHASLIAAWSIDLGHGILITHNLSLINISLLFLSAILAFSDQRKGAIGCALISLMMALIAVRQAALLVHGPLSSPLITACMTSPLFLLTALCMIISIVQTKDEESTPFSVKGLR